MGRRNFMHSLIVLVSISTYYSHLFFCIIRTVYGIFIAKRYFVNVCTTINLHHTNRLVWCRIGTFFTFPLVSAPIFALRFSNHPHRYTLLIPFRMHKLNKIKRSESNLFKENWFFRGRCISPVSRALWVNVQDKISFG